jgi:hypothetical protein
MASTASTNYVNALYTNLIGFNDPTGAAAWATQIDGGTSPYNVANAFLDFYQTSAVPVALLYQAALGRLPDYAGFTFWLNNYKTVSAGNPLLLSKQFYDSAEFAAKMGGDPTDLAASAYVQALYLNVLGRAGDASGVIYWTNALTDAEVAGGGTDAAKDAARNELLGVFAASAENVSNNGKSIETFTVYAAFNNAAPTADEFTAAAALNELQVVTGVVGASPNYGAAGAAPVPIFALSVVADPASIAEGTTGKFTVTTNVEALADLTYNISVVGDTLGGSAGSASAADDFSGTLPTSVKVAAGAMTSTFDLSAKADNTAEGPEGFKVTLLNGATPVVSTTALITDATVDGTAPVVTAAQTISYAENQVADAVLGTVAATDNVAVTGFEIASGNTDGFFAIGADGKLTLTDAGLKAAANDFETTPNSFTLGVMAMDAAGNKSAATNVTVNVTDVDDVPPTFDTATRSATTITLNFSEALDTASVPAASSFNVLKGGNTAITVSTVTVSGKTVTLGLAAPLADADAVSVTYTPPATSPVQDVAGNDAATFTVAAVVKDVTPPTIAAQTFAYVEGAPTTANPVVGTVVAGGGDVASFAITSGNGNNFFSIDNTGKISLTTAGLAATAASNDFETTPNAFALGVTATDNAGNVSTAATITLNVTDNPADNLAAPIISSLTIGADPAIGVVLGSNNDDITSGLVSGTAGETTFSSIDFINLGDNGVNGDTLNIELRGASYTGGATVQNVENLKLTATTAQTFNATGITSVTKVINNASPATLTVTNLSKAALNFEIGNIDTAGAGAGVYNFADGELNGTQVAKVTVTANVGTTNAQNLTFAPTTAVPNSLAEININAKGGTANLNLITDAAQTSLKTIKVEGTNAATISVADATGNLETTATTLDASGNSGGVRFTGLGAATHKVTGGAGNDRFDFGANLDSTDIIIGGGNTSSVGDILSANGAQLAAVTNAVKPTVTGIETLMIANDVDATATTVDAALFGGGVGNVRIVDQGTTNVAAVTFNNLTSLTTNTFRFDGDVGASGGSYTFNILNAQDAGTNNSALLDLRNSTGAFTGTSAVVLNGVENITVDTTNATGAATTFAFNITDAALQTLTLKGGKNIDLTGANLGAGVTTVNATGLTGTATADITLNTAATTGAAVTTAGGADTIVGSQLNDTISTFGGADDITGLGGADKLNGGDGNDTFRYTATAQTGVATFGSGSTSTSTLDILTVNAGDFINLTGSLGTDGNYDAFGVLQVAGNLSNVTTANTVERVLGVYDSTAGTFTVGTTGANAVMLNWSNGDDTSSDESIILVGVTDVSSVTNGVVTV